MKKESKTILNLRNILFEQITSNINDVHINGCMENRISGNLNFSFPQLKGQSIINSIPRIAVSSGSACTSSSPTSSHVLHSIGLSNKLSNSSIRIGIGRFNSEEQILSASNDIISAVRKKTS
jgi:cysteine desulfurase